MTEIEALIARASASCMAPWSPILFPSNLKKGQPAISQGRDMGWGGEAYKISVSEVLTRRASAIFEAPSSPILLSCNLIEEER
jgi:hypothetical protein